MSLTQRPTYIVFVLLQPQARAPGGHIQITIMIDTQQQYIKLNIRGEISIIVVQAHSGRKRDICISMSLTQRPTYIVFMLLQPQSTNFGHFISKVS
jgi:hypothetical protein